MALTTPEKLKLMQMYEPVLFLHRNENFAPISPRAYIESSSLWSYQETDFPFADNNSQKKTWGKPLLSEDFPRTANVTASETSVEPSDLNDENRVYLGFQDEDGKFIYLEPPHFLDHQGWSDPDDDLHPSPIVVPEPGEVTEQTLNRVCNINRIDAVWGLPEIPEDIPPPFVKPNEEVQESVFRYSAEVHDSDSLLTALSLQEDGEKAKLLKALLPLLAPGNVWFIFYHLFYPAHEQDLRICEFIALIQKLGIELSGGEPFKFPLEFNTKGLLASLGEQVRYLETADYAGDYQSICLIVENPGIGSTSIPVSPLDLEEDEFPAPKLVALGRRIRGAIEVQSGGALPNPTGVDVQLMPIVDNPETIGNTHVKVYVAKGTHNNYDSPGQKPSPINDSPVTPACEFYDVDEDTPPPVDDKYHKRRTIAITIAKLLAGGVAGLFAALWEMARDSDPDPAADPEEIFDPEVPDEPPEEGEFRFIIAPESQLEALGEQFSGELIELRPWGGDSTSDDPLDPMTNLVQAEQIWWPPEISNPGASWRFGVNCLDDPFNWRSGMKIPDFKVPLVKGLIEYLAK